MTTRRWVGIGVGIALLATALLVWTLRDDPAPPRATEPGTTASETTPTEIAKVAAPTQITGTVTPRGAAMVWLVGAQAARDARASVDGAFVFEDVEPGTYCVAARAAALAASRCDITVARGATQHVELALAAEGRFALSGVIRDGGGGPIAGAQLVARRQPLGDRIAVATSDAQGAYRLELTPGDHRVEVSADGYAPIARFLEIIADREESFALVPAGAITGIVLDAATRTPVAGAELRWRFDFQQRGAFVDFKRNRAISAADGTFELRGLPAGAFHVTARGPDGTTSGEVRGRLALGDDERVEILLRPGITVRGHVRWKGTTEPIAGATVETSGALPPRTTTADARGAFAVEGVLVGELPLYARHAGAEALQFVLVGPAGRDDVLLELPRLSAIEGRVLSPARSPVAGAHVAIGSNAPIRTDADGRFHVDVPPGSVHVAAKHDAHGTSEPITVDVAAGRATQIELVLGGDAAIEGTVRTPSGQPVPNTKIELETRVSRLRSQVATDARGSYRFSGLRPGTYTVVASPRGASGKFVADGARAHVELAAGQTKRGVDLVALVGDKTITGRVVDETGAPLAGAEVWAERTGGKVSVQGSPADATAYTLGDGTFELLGIPDGEYAVGAFHVAHDSARTYGVKAGARDVTIAFEAAGSIAGTVTTSVGTPVPVFTLDWSFDAGKNFGASRRQVFTAGTFRIDALPPRGYKLTATGPGGEAGEAEWLELAPGEARTGIAITVAGPGGIRGRLVDRKTKQPLAAVDVSGEGARTRTGADGRFLLDGVRSGTNRSLWVFTRTGASRLDNTRFDLVIEPGKVTDIGDFEVTVD